MNQSAFFDLFRKLLGWKCSAFKATDPPGKGDVSCFAGEVYNATAVAGCTYSPASGGAHLSVFQNPRPDHAKV